MTKLTFSTFHDLLNSLLEEDSCLMTGADEILFLKTKNANRTGALPEAARNIKKYLQLDAGDIVLLNDPYSGGGPSNEFTFVVLLESFSTLFYYSVKRNFGPLHSPAEHIEKEGLRITPVPIKQKGQINVSIIEAIDLLPSAPFGLNKWLLEQLQELESWIERARLIFENCSIGHAKAFFREYLDQSAAMTQKILMNLAPFDSRQEVRPQSPTSHEFLKLHVEFKDGKFLFDWNASQEFIGLHLTESYVWGACCHYLHQEYQLPIMNSGSFSHFRIVKNHQSFLNSRYPKPMMRGLGLGVEMLLLLIESTISLVARSVHPFEIHMPSTHIHLASRSTQWDFRVPGDPCGCPLLEPHFSIEALERHMPLVIQKMGYRNLAASIHSQARGTGLFLRVEVLRNVLLTLYGLDIQYENLADRKRFHTIPYQLQVGEEPLERAQLARFRDLEPGETFQVLGALSWTVKATDS